MTQPSGSQPGNGPEHDSERTPARRPQPRIVARFVAISWHDLALTFGPILLVCVTALYLAVRLIQPAPPSTLTIAAGPKGSFF